MISAKRILTILGVLFCALTTGYLMQTYAKGPSPDAVRVASKSVVQDVTPVEEAAEDAVDIEDIKLTAAAPVPPAGAPQPAALPDQPVTLAALDDQPITGLPKEESAPNFSCEISLTAEPAAAAFVRLALDAACLQNERFTMHHNGMMFTGTTDGAGQREMLVPALSKNAVFIVSFGKNDGAVANTQVTTLEHYDRFVVQWQGETGLQVHALEYGADYGAAGHVWAGAAGDMSLAVNGEGGFVTRLGDEALDQARIAEVYTFPTGTAQKDGDVSISLEAEVNRANCGRDVEAQALQKSGPDPVRVSDIVIAVPECDAVGDFLVLKNTFDDLKIARN